MNTSSIVIMDKEEWSKFLAKQEEILSVLRSIPRINKHNEGPQYISAKEYMDAVRIRRTKFDQLVRENKIKVLKKRRKIYVPFSEIERFFTDPKVA